MVGTLHHEATPGAWSIGSAPVGLEHWLGPTRRSRPCIKPEGCTSGMAGCGNPGRTGGALRRGRSVAPAVRRSVGQRIDV